MGVERLVPGHLQGLVPHGMSVILNAPACVEFTAQACPDRHLQVGAVAVCWFADRPLDHDATPRRGGTLVC